MSKIARYSGNLRAFGSEAQGLERTLFGETTQADDLTSQITPAFLRGWGVVGPSEHPSLEDFNASMYATSQFLAYQHQMGVPEWHAEQEYYIGSICSYDGELYQSLSNANIGSQPPSSKWTLVINVKNGAGKLGLGTAATKNVGVGASQIPDMSNFTFSNGQSGWLKTPGGMIQWGRIDVSGTTTAKTLNVTFPVPFPNASVAYSFCFLTGDPSQRFAGVTADTLGFKGSMGVSYVTPSPNTILYTVVGY